jgi:protein-L-isoaspartate(D-aspartate) O-methyltransferase
MQCLDLHQHEQPGLKVAGHEQNRGLYTFNTRSAARLRIPKARAAPGIRAAPYSIEILRRRNGGRRAHKMTKADARTRLNIMAFEIKRRPLLRTLGLVAALAGGGAQAEDPFARERAALLQEIAAMASETGAETGRPVFSARVMAAMGKVPRHRFVPATYRALSYADRPLPIGHGQTISQPYIVALMSELLELKAGDAVLEIGTGSGYQAAVLAELAASVYTIEIIEPVGKNAAALLQQLGYTNIHTRIGDGYHGWPERAPFDAIIVTAAAEHVPPALAAQLKPGGRMVIPLGGEGEVQFLQVIVKQADGSVSTQRSLPVRFVPLTRRN